MFRVCFVPCDVTKKEQFINLFDKTEEFFQVACVDLLANNAGINLNKGWRLCMEVTKPVIKDPLGKNKTRKEWRKKKRRKRK